MSGILERLTTIAADYRDPVREVPWDDADPARPWLPDSVVSLSTLPVWADMDADARRAAGRVDFARLCAAGLWLEGLLIHRVTNRGFVAADAMETRVCLQEVREEAGHGLMFLEMIDRAGMGGVHLLGPTRLLHWVAKRLDPAGAAFWAMVFIGESVTDTFALKALRAAEADGQALCPTAEAVMRLHHRDEARHMAAAKALIDVKLQRMGRLRRLVFRVVVRLLIDRFLAATLYPTTASLRALGIADASRLVDAVRRCPKRRALVRACAESAMQLIDGRMRGMAVAE